MIKTLLVVVVMVAAAVVLLSVRVILKKNGRFSHQHISQSKAMRERGIDCVNTQDWKERREADRKLDVKNL